jgi:hypothetical protein
MPKHSFDNKYNIVIWTFSHLLHGFEDSANLFVAQCIWWIASLVKLTDVLAYYHQYNIFVSEYLNRLRESSISNTWDSPTTIQNRDISPLDLPLAEELAVSNNEPVSLDPGLEECSELDSDYVDTRIQTVVSKTNQYLTESRRLRELHQLQQRSNPIRTRKQRATASASRGCQELKDRQDLINSLGRSKDYINIELESIFGVLTKWERKDLRKRIKDSRSITWGLQKHQLREITLET